jgi:hypothetical protein
MRWKMRNWTGGWDLAMPHWNLCDASFLPEASLGADDKINLPLEV